MYTYFRDNAEFKNNPLLRYELKNLRIVIILVWLIDVVCLLALDRIYFTGTNTTILYYLRLYLWVGSVTVLMILSFVRSFENYLRLAILVTIVLHGHVFVISTFWLGVDGLVYGGMYVIIAVVLSYFSFKFTSATNLLLVGSMLVIYWCSALYYVWDFMPGNHDARLFDRLLLVPDIKNVMLAVLGATTVSVLVDFAYYQLNSVNKFIHDSSSQLSEYDSRRLLWLENMSKYLKHETDNSILSIKMEVSNLKKKSSGDSDLHLDAIEIEVDQIERILLEVTEVKELEKALVPRDRKPMEVKGYLEDYVENFIPSRCDVQVVFEGVDKEMEMLCDASSFTQMLDKIVSNCVDYADTNTDVVVRYLAQGSVSSLIEITNQGPLLRDDHLETIFDIFHGREQDGHSGFGLFIAKTIVEYHSGIIEAFNSEEGPVFRITTPALFANRRERVLGVSSYFTRL